MSSIQKIGGSGAYLLRVTESQAFALAALRAAAATYPKSRGFLSRDIGVPGAALSSLERAGLAYGQDSRAYDAKLWALTTKGRRAGGFAHSGGVVWVRIEPQAGE